MLEKIDNWVLTSLGGVAILIGSFFTFFFKSFFDRLNKAELKIKEIDTKTTDFRASMREKLKDQQDQNTREHDKIVIEMNKGLNNVGRSIDIIREDQKTILESLLSDKK